MVHTDTPLFVYWLGRRSYIEGIQWQIWARERALQGECIVLLLEHEPVFTIGRGGSFRSFRVPLETLNNEGIEIWEIGRGGDVTYHGPGQLVGYPIIPLKNHDMNIITFLRHLESALIAALQEFHIHSFQIQGKTGVWTQHGKIASIGIRVARGISAHGFALNVRRTIEPFQYIFPCGMDIQVTSMEEETSQKLHVFMPCTSIAEKLAQVFAHSTWQFEDYSRQNAPPMPVSITHHPVYTFVKCSPI